MMSELDYEKLSAMPGSLTNGNRNFFRARNMPIATAAVLPLRICWPKRQKQGE